MRFRKRMASTCDDALLGLRVTTPRALLEELWNVWGTHERLISMNQRSMIVKAVLDEQEEWVRSAGTVALLADFVQDHLTFLDTSFCEEHAHQFTPTDRSIVSFARAYEAALVEAGLIEPAQALIELAAAVKLPRVVIAMQQPLPACSVAFFEKVSQKVSYADPQLLMSQTQEGTLPDDRSYLLLKPQGQTVSALMVDEVLVEGGMDKKTIITSPDPKALFDSIGRALVSQGFIVSFRASRSFPDTHFGRAYDAAVLLCGPAQQLSRETMLQAAATYLGSPYAQLSPHRRDALMRVFRGDRTLSIDEVRGSLRSSSRPFEYFEELVEESDADILFGFFEDMVHRMELSNAEKESELAAIMRVKSLYREARKLGQEPASFFDLIDALSVPCSRTIVPNGLRVSEDAVASAGILPFTELPDGAQGLVLITSFDKAASLPARCCDTVIMTSLDSGHYSGAQKRSTLTEFLARYHLPCMRDVLAEMEACFMRNVGLAQRRVVFEYAQQNADGEEFYPAFFLESFKNDRELAGFPLEERTQGETNFDLAARVVPLSDDDLSCQPRRTRGSLSPQERSRLFSYALDAQGIERPVISPSALEQYRECPYLWFVQRKLNLDDDGEEFGPREQGVFAHKVFQSFYDQWAQCGHDRVSNDTLDEARSLLVHLFDELVIEQAAMQPGNRYVATSELECEQIAHLEHRLLDSLSFQKDIFPSYHVFGHEIDLSPEQKIVYAGAIMRGRMDRIDIDGKGNYVVIDYKGSTNRHDAGYQVPEDPADEGLFEAPAKIQALVYAQAYRRLNPGLHPKAAVYLNYRAKTPKDLLKGSIVETSSTASTHAHKKSIVEGNFESYLDLVEADLAKTVKRMLAGDIAPDPRDAKACEYCPVLYCEKRVDGS